MPATNKNYKVPGTGLANAKLMQYSTMAGALLLTGSAADAQVIYTDIDPDTTIIDDYYWLDINNDGINDFGISQRAIYYTSYYYGYIFDTNKKVSIGAVNSNEVLRRFGSKWTFPSEYWADMLPGGEQIGTGIFWVDDAILAYSVSFGSFGDWFGSNGYMGVRMEISGQWHYGWVRLSASPNAGSVLSLIHI